MIDIEEYKDRKDLTSLELDILYAYLDLEMQNMSDEEKSMWHDILNQIDPDEEL
jgi:succinate dehydrogenase flavin-adding protein (antitoxin of CptAB toxin-antitoxin module)